MRHWLITEISSGLGKALAESVMARGDVVIGTFRTPEQVAVFNDAHRGAGEGILLDVTDHRAIEAMVADVVGRYGRIDVLVNNAGVGFVGAVEETSMAEARGVFEANFFSALKLTQAVLPIMRRGRGGHIVQVSLQGGVKAFAGFGIYNASKFALEGFSEALAQEVGPLGIRVTLVEPGPFRTNFAGRGLGLAETEIPDYADTAGAFRTRLQGVHGKQEGDPRKAAEAIIDRVNGDDPGLRLPLGKTALVTIGMKIDSLTADLDRNRAVAENAVFGE